MITGRSLPEVSCPASLVSFLPPVLGWLARGVIAPELEVGLSTTALPRRLPGGRAHLDDRDRHRPAQVQPHRLGIGCGHASTHRPAADRGESDRVPQATGLGETVRRATVGGGERRGPGPPPRLGHHLAQWLLARGETVVDVPATATARVRELSRGRRKTDTLDAAATASVAALHGDARPVPAEGSATVLGMLDEHRPTSSPSPTAA
jgi:hypothetical protein